MVRDRCWAIAKCRYANATTVGVLAGNRTVEFIAVDQSCRNEYFDFNERYAATLRLNFALNATKSKCQKTRKKTHLNEYAYIHFSFNLLVVLNVLYTLQTL